MAKEPEGGIPGTAVENGRPRTRAAWRGLWLVLAVYLSAVLGMVFLETWLVYPIPPLNYADWRPAGLDFEDVWFTSADGTKLHGWFIDHPQRRQALLYCHGNGENVAMNADFVAQLSQALEAAVFIFDYRGYGHSDGSPDESGCIADGLAAQRWLAERVGATTGDIIVMGRSLGAAVAAAVAAEQGARALVLVNGFSRMTDVAAFHYPWLPVRQLMRNRYDSLTRIRKFTGPLFQSHGTRDSIVPIQLGRSLFDAAPTSNKTFVEIPDLNHNDAEPGSYYQELASFLGRLPESGGKIGLPPAF
jgi:fermentation-respiration switch protein FrsA (DUF1100 family)